MVGFVERMDDRRWPKKVKDVTLEDHQERERPRFGLLEEAKRTLAVSEVGLQEATQFARARIA